MMAPTLMVALEYAAPARCPSQEQFWESVAYAAPDLRRADAGELARRYRVVIEPSAAGGFHGELTEQGKSAPRELEAADCAELAEALALMLVLSTEQDPVPVQPAQPEAATTTPVVAVGAPARRDLLSPPEPELETPTTEAALGGLVWWGAAPDPLLGIAVGFQQAFGAVIVARLEARAALARNRADATYVGLAPQVCARARWPVFGLAACAGAAVGALQIKGVEYSGPGSQSRAWLAALLGARVSLALAEPLLLELSVEGEHGFIERNYRVKSDASEFATPQFSALFVLAAGARF
jgi:hypothetical protein